MTWHLRAYIADGKVAHVHCSTAQIISDAIETPENCFKVTAEVAGEYQSAAVVFPILAWDGSSLNGLPFISQRVLGEAG